MIFLPEGEVDSVTLTYGQLHARARTIAARLQCELAVGDRVLLLHPPGLDFVAAFFGCLYAGVVAVAAYPPRNARHMPRVEAILSDAQSRVILSTREGCRKIETWLGDRILGYSLMATDEVGPSAEWVAPELSADTVALLQYSSGSSGQPRGVMISHGNLMANAEMIRRRFGYHDESSFVSWLPMYHDMGLIGNLLQPIYLGTSTVIMPPAAFLQKPVRWLAAISRYKARTTGAPNFAFDLCARVVTPEQKVLLDLSSLELIYNGSEPIDARAVESFTRAFGQCGLRPGALYACYGMAETTLLVTGSQAGHGVRVLEVDGAELAAHRAVPASDTTEQRLKLVSCGFGVEGQTLTVVDPETRTVLSDGCVGEIWLQGPHVASGYWRQPEKTRETMAARLADGRGPWLRTGDLGFLRDGELYVTGRIKDIIIVRGKNHYPQDIERSVETSHPALQPGSCAAFSVTIDGVEKLGIAAEVQRTALRTLEPDTVVSALRRAVSEAHEIAVDVVALLKPVTLPKTSSGKLQRFAARERLQAGTLDVVHLSGQFAVAAAPATLVVQRGLAPGLPAPDVGASQVRADAMISWIRGYAEQRINSFLIDERRCIPPHIVLDFGTQGLLGLEVPVAAGGSGLTCRDTLRVAVQLGAIDVNLSSFVGVHNALGLRTLLRHGTPAMHAGVLPRLAAGRELVAFAFTEPGAGSNPRAISATATPDGAGGWKLNGSKKWIGTGAWSGWIVTAAHLLDEAGNDRGITAFLLRQGLAGLRQGAEELTMGMRGMVQNTVHLEGVRVGPEDILGQLGNGMAVAQDTMKFGRLFIATVSLGTMQRCVQLMLRYASHRSMSTGRLLDNLVARERLSEHLMRIAALRSFVEQFGGWYDEGLDVPEEMFALVKYAGPESLGLAVDHLLQMLGGRGYIETNLVPQLYRDARLVRIFEGPTETMVMFLGSRIASQSRPLQDFLRGRLRAPEIADRVFAAADLAKQHHLASGDGGAQSAAVQRVSLLLGEFGIPALWLAVLENDPASSDPALVRARAWLRDEMAAKYARLAQAIPAHAQPFSAGEILEQAARHREAIGDVEPLAAGVEHALDPMLRRAAVASAVAEVVSPPPVPPTILRTTVTAVPRTTGDGAKKIETWLRAWVGRRLSLAPETIDPTKPFSDFGIDSMTAVELSTALGESLNVELPTTLAWDFPNIGLLAANVGVLKPGNSGTTTSSASGALSDTRLKAELDALSEEELAALVAAELKELRPLVRS